jgi:two-component system, NarL family, sensor kinase
MRLDALCANPADEATTGRQLAECAKLVEQCMREVRTVSYLLYPPMLDELGLKTAIPWYLEGFSRRSGIKTTFQASDDFERLSRDADLALFRVLQESLTNIHKHSGSSTADVRIFHEGQSVILEVVDQGNGLPAAILQESGREWAGSTGVGMRGMSERLRHLGGVLKITSSEAGTRLQAILPLTQTTQFNRSDFTDKGGMP